MENRIGTFTYLAGESYEIGRKQGTELSRIPEIERLLFADDPVKNKRVEHAIVQLKTYYPSLLEELTGIADYFNREVSEHLFLDTAYLVTGGCSLAVFLSRKSSDKKPYVLRTYDLGTNLSDFRLCSTSGNNQFMHTGFSVHFLDEAKG